jgi:trehalose 6-phosphate phosphatase
VEFRSPEARRRYAEVVAAAPRAVVGLDFDGVLSPIVDDPSRAVIHPDGPAVLTRLARCVRAVAVVTGRPARQAVALGELERVADGLPEDSRLLVLGQYGNERWDSSARTFSSSLPPEGLAALLDTLPNLLEEHDAREAFVEDKGLAVAVHTRRLPDPAAAYQRLLGPLAAAAERHGLALEPGRLVIEVRAPGMDKGAAIRTLVEELDPGALMFAGDDLGDVEAFRAVSDLREGGLPGLLVCAGSTEQEALVELSDIVVDGPDGVLHLLDRFTDEVTSHPAT